jgi:hypothetical protein
MPDPQRASQRPPQRTAQRRKIVTDSNMFDLDLSLKPEGMTYAWRRVTIGGMEDTRRQIVSESNGWTPVPGNRHPELMGSRGTDQPIIMGGQMLMEIPEGWETEMRSIDEFTARYTLEETMQRLNGNERKRGTGKGVTRHAARVSELVE